VLAIASMLQLRYWENSYTLFSRALDVTDRNLTANMCVGLWYVENHDYPDATRCFEIGLSIDPDSPEAHARLGGMLREKGDLQAALHHLAYAARRSPRDFEARHNLANVLSDLGRTDDAIFQFDVALRLNPDSAQAHFNYGATLARDGKFDRAIQQFDAALRLRPAYVDARFLRALALVQIGKVDEAKREFQIVLQARPTWTEAMERMAWTLATSPNPASRDPIAAVSLAEYANRQTMFEQPALLDTLGAAYAAAGRFDDAIAMGGRARQLASDHGMNELARRIDARIELYRSHRPYLASPGATSAPSSRPAYPASTRTAS